MVALYMAYVIEMGYHLQSRLQRHSGPLEVLVTKRFQ